MKTLPKLNFLKPVTTKLFKLLTKKHKINFVILIVLSIGFSLIETIGISAIMPFISIVSDPALLESGIYKTVFDFFGFTDANSFIITVGILIICFYFFRGIYSVGLSYIISRYSFGLYKYFSKMVLKINLSISYRLFAQKNSAEIMHSTTSEPHSISKIALNFLLLCSELFTIIMIYSLIVFLNWRMTLVVTAVLLLVVFILLTIITKINKRQGVKKFESGRKINRILKETLGNIKFVKLKGNEDTIIKEYDKNISAFSKAEIANNFLNVTPKNILESLGFSFLIAVIVFVLWIYDDASMVIPVITMYALALYRILPSVNRILQNINGIAYSQRFMEGANENINQPIETEGSFPLEFSQRIRLDNINFKYVTGGDVLCGISLEIKKGEKIAITGESGGGKSTLVDIITGIHKPISGTLYIDNTAVTNDNIRSWRKNIGYIPQNIYLFDGTVAENVSFASVYDKEKIIKALKMANIWDFLSTKEGINTLVGDGGIQLSGGQQQRIGIARALYDDPQVLVLDEATSALDTETEQKIMDEIYTVSANKTLIVIAHRLSTVERCNRKIRIENGRIV